MEREREGGGEESRCEKILESINIENVSNGTGVGNVGERLCHKGTVVSKCVITK